MKPNQPGALENVEYPFIAIIPCLFLNRIICIYYNNIYRSNGTAQLFTKKYYKSLLFETI